MGIQPSMAQHFAFPINNVVTYMCKVSQSVSWGKFFLLWVGRDLFYGTYLAPGKCVIKDFCNNSRCPQVELIKSGGFWSPCGLVTGTLLIDVCTHTAEVILYVFFQNGSMDSNSVLSAGKKKFKLCKL